MPDQSLYSEYVEALSALSSVDNLQRGALRKAVEGASTEEQRARTAMATQQRMYDQAGREADHAEHLLDELRATLGVPKATTDANPEAGTPEPLLEIRSRITDVARWVAEIRPVADSLLRSRNRLDRTGASNPRRSGGPVAERPTRRRRHLAVIGLVAAGLVAAVIVVVAIAR